MKELSVDDLMVDPDHPRTIFAEGEIAALCEHLRQRGQIMPLIVFNHDGKAMIVDGARRWIAAKRAGLTRMTAIVLPGRPSETDLRVLQVRLDFHRASHNPIERSNMLAQILQKTGWSITELATQLSMKQPLVTKYLSLQRIAEVQSLAATGALDDLEKAYLISRLPDHESQIAMAKECASLSREATKAKFRSKGKPTVKAKRAVFMLPGGASITFKGEESTLADVIERLTLMLKELRKGLSQSFDITTVQKVFKDKAKVNHVG